MTDPHRPTDPDKGPDPADPAHDLRAAAAAAREGVHAAAQGGTRAALDGAADRASNGARAVDEAAAGFDPAAFPARALESVALLLDDTARGLRGADLDTALDALRERARGAPLAYIAGAAALGFAAARLAQASGGGGSDRDAAASDGEGSTAQAGRQDAR
jgi:hypothetical protein